MLFRSTTISTGLGLIKNITIGAAQYYFPNNATANANTSLKNTFNFDYFPAYPISSVLLLNGGGGLSQIPDVVAHARVPDTSSDSANNYAYIKNIGILAPIQIANGGSGYQINDTIVITGGSGYGAYANVTNVSVSGAITEIKYVIGAKSYPLGGMGYRLNGLPTLSVSSSNPSAANAELFVPGILGDGATFSCAVDKVGAVGAITINDPGQDYSYTPYVSLKVQDIVVSNVSLYNPPKKGDVIYQGTSIENYSYTATVNSVSLLQGNADPTLSLYNLRVFNYDSTTTNGKPLAVNGIIHNANNDAINMVMSNTAFSSNYDETGVRTYGDGKAKASASFLNGLVISDGVYLNEQGQPSSYSVLQSEDFNSFTYQITVEKEIEKYRDILLNLLHPTGMKVIGRYALKSNTNILDMRMLESLYSGKSLDAYTGYTASEATMVADFVNMSNNIITFSNLAGANVENFIFAGNSAISITTPHGPNVRSDVISVNGSANSITITDNVWLTFANVAIVNAETGSNVINITSVTDSYDLINGGDYSNTAYPMMDIVYAGDTIKVANNTNKTVNYVDYVNGIIYLTSNLSDNVNSFLSVNRTLTGVDGQVIIYGPLGLSYTPELTTEDGITLITEDGKIIILG